MKGWCKILELEEYDILAQRLVTTDDGEHVQITVRFPDGQFIKTASFGDGSDAEKLAISLLDEYKEKNAQEFVDELNKLRAENDNEEDSKEED